MNDRPMHQVAYRQPLEDIAPGAGRAPTRRAELTAPASLDAVSVKASRWRRTRDVNDVQPEVQRYRRRQHAEGGGRS